MRYLVCDYDLIPLREQPQNLYTLNQAICRAQREAECLATLEQKFHPEKSFQRCISDCAKYFHIMNEKYEYLPEYDNAI